MRDIYSKLLNFKQKYPATISWRLRKHAKVIENYINNDETVEYAFAAQKSLSMLSFFTTYAVVLTNKRIIIGQKRMLFGHLYTAITPDMFNDLSVKKGLFWGIILIDTVKETVRLSMIQPKALDEIETNISEYMMREKQKYTQEEK